MTLTHKTFNDSLLPLHAHAHTNTPHLPKAYSNIAVTFLPLFSIKPYRLSLLQTKRTTYFLLTLLFFFLPLYIMLSLPGMFLFFHLYLVKILGVLQVRVKDHTLNFLSQYHFSISLSILEASLQSASGKYFIIYKIYRPDTPFSLDI